MDPPAMPLRSVYSGLQADRLAGWRCCGARLSYLNKCLRFLYEIDHSHMNHTFLTSPFLIHTSVAITSTFRSLTWDRLLKHSE